MLTMTAVRGGSLEGAAAAKHFQCLHHRLGPWAIRYPHRYLDLSVQLCVFN